MAVKLQTIKDIRNYIKSELSDLYSLQESSAIAGLVISKIFNLASLSEVLKRADDLAGNENVDLAVKYCQDLKSGIPVQYVLGETTFYNCIIRVNKGVLIPRQETEELVDLIIRENIDFSGKILDIGTGSGCIAIALAKNLVKSSVTGIDNSEPALKVAAENAVLNKAGVVFKKADVFRFQAKEFGKTEIIVSNPPYVRVSEKGLMSNNVLGYEPHEALFVPDEDPLLYYRAVLEYAMTGLEKQGKVYFEINESMGYLIREMLIAYNFKEIVIVKDINGKDRIAKARKNDGK